MRVTTTSLKRHGLAALLLVFGVLFHMLCSAGHAAEASEAALGSATATPTTVQPQADADPAAASPHVHLAGGTHDCGGAADASADPRGSAPTLQALLLAVGLAVLIALWAPRLPAYIRPAAQGRRARRRNAAPLLLALCVWRI
ncbi:hypothetical protein [Nocardiopsis tropica]|uniref:Uncharacterized protein n=1 Tax=Nocardiopsis tropica TaxID=109330 RepID=A0ABU7KK41_9ACTN|nr:hypothetical protein [Nocardiopsis umidischolae]MEE2049654.1 hypothetical protein [Nocardiopsis umidischolae]